MNNSFRMIRMLGVVSLTCGLLIVATHVNTLARIRENQDIIMRESVAQLLPGIAKQVVYAIEPSGEISVKTEGEGKRFIAGYDGAGKFLGVVLEGSERGYADLITAMYAYSPESKTITGFKVVDMRETPGLGSRIGSDLKFLENFKSLDTTHEVKTVKSGTKKYPWEIDAISGATISSRAVGRLLANGVRETVPLIEKNLERIRKGV